MKTLATSLFDRFEEIIGSVLLIAITVICAIQVLFRYLFGSPLVWAEELSVLLFSYLVFTGAALALKTNEHFSVNILKEKLSPMRRVVLEKSILAIVLVFCLCTIFYSFNLILAGLNVNSSVLGIPRAWFYGSVPFGLVLMLIRTLQRLFNGGSVEANNLGQ